MFAFAITLKIAQFPTNFGIDHVISDKGIPIPSYGPSPSTVDVYYYNLPGKGGLARNVSRAHVLRDIVAADRAESCISSSIIAR
jgi:hypothetical protein